LRLAPARNVKRLETGSAVRIHGEAAGEIPIESIDPGSEQAWSAEQRIVARCLDEHVVARLEERRAHEEVRAGRALGGCHLFGRHAVARGDRFDERRIAAVVLAVEGNGLAGTGKLVNRARENIAVCKIEPWGRPLLCPFEIRRMESGGCHGVWCSVEPGRLFALLNQ